MTGLIGPAIFEGPESADVKRRRAGKAFAGRSILLLHRKNVDFSLLSNNQTGVVIFD